MKNAMLKNALTEIVRTKSRFISIFGILAIGCGFFAGLTVSENDMKLSSDTYFDNSRLMDFRLLSTYGFDENDITALEESADGVHAYPAYYADCFLGENGGGDVVRLYSLDEPGKNNGYNTLVITEGRLPESPDECMVDGADLRSSYKLGDTLKLSGNGIEDTLTRTEYTVVGFYRSPMFIDDTGRGNTTIGSGAIETTAYIPQENFTYEYYTTMYVTVDGLTPYNAYSEDYERLRDEVREILEDVGEERKALRREEIVSEAEEELADGEKEYEEQKADAEKRLDDAKAELDDAKKQLDDGKKELEDSRNQLDDAKAELEDGKKQLDGSKKQLDDGKKELDENRILLNDTKAQLDEGKKELDESLPKLNAAEKEVKDGEKRLAGAKAQLEQGKAELDENRGLLDSSAKQIESGERELAAAQKELKDSKAQLDSTEKRLDESEKTLAESKKTLDETKTRLDSAKAQLESTKRLLDSEQAKADESRALAERQLEQGIITEEQAEAIYDELDKQQLQLDAGKAVYEDGLKQYNDQYARYEDGLKQYNGGYEEYLKGAAALNAGKLQYEQGLARYEDGKKTLDDSRKRYEDGEKQYAEGLEKYNEGLKEYQSGLKEWTAGKKEYEDGLAEYNAGKKRYDEGLEKYSDGERQYSLALSQYRDGLKQYNDGMAEYEQNAALYEQGEKEYAEGLKKYEESKEKYDDGAAEYEKGRSEAEEKLADAREKLDDAKKEIDSLAAPEWYIFDRTDNAGFSEYGQNADRIHNIALIFPLFFAMVAVLVCLTTMTRMVEEQRTQIGTLKALGYGSGAIMFKYMLYGLSAALAGAVFGIFVGMKIFPYIIMNAYGMIYELPQYLTPYDFRLMLLVVLAAFALAGVTVYFSCKNILREQPASLMRPKAPKSGKKILLERVGFIWKHLSFSRKVSLRNLFRYKRRMLMTIVGIAGCTALLLTGFGIHDSISDILNKQFEEISLYNGMAVCQEDISDAGRGEAVGLFEKYGCDAEPVYQKQITVKNGNDSADANIFGIDGDAQLKKYVDLHDRRTGEKYSLGDDTVIINEKLALLLGGAKVGDKITLALSDSQSADAVIGAICENYAYHYVYISGALYQKLFGGELPYNAFYFNTPYGDGAEKEWKDGLAEELMKIDGVAAVSYKTAVGDTFRQMIKSLQLIVVVLIVCAGILAFIVLYNLTNININERIREIATLKVLGFYDKEVSVYVFRETVLLTLSGTVVGLLLGRILLDFVVRTAEIDMLMFGRDVHPLSFVWSILLTLVFAVIVMLFMHRKLKYINMVEALKSVE